MMIVSYINRTESESCLLHLYDWEKFINEVDSVTNREVSCALIANPKNRYEFMHTLKRYGFKHAVYIDENDSFNKANHFPAKMSYHTFLVDRDNKVIFIGNPINSSQVRKSYMDLIKGNAITYKKDKKQSAASVSASKVNIGKIKLGAKRKTSIRILNTGENTLVLQDAKTSCGCMTVNFDKQPIKEREAGIVEVTYHATAAGFFNKTIRIFCNTPDSPYIVNIMGMVIE